MRFTQRYRVIIVIALGLVLFRVAARPAQELPSRLSDEEFWKLTSDFSEPDGNFHSDNFVSNERSFQHVLSDLSRGRQPGSAYIGVGPEQNFTYLLAVKPKLAFIVDIRRQNLIQHLMFKAIFELSLDRAEFISRLFSRPRRPNAGRNSTVAELFDAFRSSGPDMNLYQDNLQAIRNKLMKEHGFALNTADQSSLEYVFRSFFRLGPNLTYDGVQVGLTGAMPSFEQLMRETDQDGASRSFMATEDNFQFLKDMHRRNALVPVVGDFAGPKALRSVGQYLKDHNATVTAFYTSNVEQYLFMSEESWRKFYSNVSTLPVDGRSVFIRGLIRSEAGDLSSSPALPLSSHYETGLFSIADLVASFKAGKILTYYDVIR